MSNKTKENCVVIFSSDDWGWKTSKFQISNRLSNYTHVLFVSSIGFRKASVSKADSRRIINKLKSFFKGLKEINDNLHVMTPIVIPGRTDGILGYLNKVFFRLQLFVYVKYLKFHNPIPMVFSQNWFSYFDALKSVDKSKLVYYCVDEQSGFKGIDANKFIRDDIALTKSAKHVFCSSKTLYEKKLLHNSNTKHFPHGVDYDLFKKGMNDNDLPVDMRGIKGTILLFFGHISYEWVDVELLKYIAVKKSDWNIVLLGRFSVEMSIVKDFDNIHYLGEKEITELPAYCTASNVGIIPFVKTELTNNCNPLKLPEYMSAGLPVVSTYIPEVLREEHVYVANEYEEFVKHCETAISNETPQLKEKRSLDMKTRSWDSKVEQLFNLIK